MKRGDREATEVVAGMAHVAIGQVWRHWRGLMVSNNKYRCRQYRHLCTHTDTCTHRHKCTHSDTHAHTQTHACSHSDTHACTQRHTCTHSDTHACAHSDMYAYGFGEPTALLALLALAAEGPRGRASQAAVSTAGAQCGCQDQAPRKAT